MINKDIFFISCCGPHMNGSDEGLQRISFYSDLTKTIPNYHQLPPLIKSSEYGI